MGYVQLEPSGSVRWPGRDAVAGCTGTGLVSRPGLVQLEAEVLSYLYTGPIVHDPQEVFVRQNYWK